MGLLYGDNIHYGISGMKHIVSDELELVEYQEMSMFDPQFHIQINVVYRKKLVHQFSSSIHKYLAEIGERSLFVRRCITVSKLKFWEWTI